METSASTGSSEAGSFKGVNVNLIIYLALAYVLWKFSDSIFKAVGLIATPPGPGEEAATKTESEGVMDLQKYYKALHEYFLKYQKGDSKKKRPAGTEVITKGVVKDLGAMVNNMYLAFHYDPDITRFIPIPRLIIDHIPKDTPEEAVIAIFRLCKTKGDIAFFSDAYLKSKKEDLYSMVKTALNDDEQKTLFSYLNSLPFWV